MLLTRLEFPVSVVNLIKLDVLAPSIGTFHWILGVGRTAHWVHVGRGKSAFSVLNIAI